MARDDNQWHHLKKVRPCWKKVLDNFHETAQSFHKVLLFCLFTPSFSPPPLPYFSSKTHRNHRFFLFSHQKTYFLMPRSGDICDQRSAWMKIRDSRPRKMRKILTKISTSNIGMTDANWWRQSLKIVSKICLFPHLLVISQRKWLRSLAE